MQNTYLKQRRIVANTDIPAERFVLYETDHLDEPESHC